jgi:hypothetical protein
MNIFIYTDFPMKLLEETLAILQNDNTYLARFLLLSIATDKN